MTQVPEVSSVESEKRATHAMLKELIQSLLSDIQGGAGDRDKRRQVEEWLRALAEKYPDFRIEAGLRDYFLAEAERLRKDFEATSDLSEKLAIGRSIESFLDKAAEYDRRSTEK